MRYFDGAMWTNHFHYPGRLPSIGDWFSSTFGTILNHWPGAAIIAVISAVVGNVVILMMLRTVLDGVQVIDEEFVGFTTAKGLLAAGAFLFLLVWQAVGWLAMNRYFQRAHFDADPTVGEAFTRAVATLPRFILTVIPLILAALVLLVIFGVVAVVAPFLLVLIVLLLIPLSVWLLVKLTFLQAAIVAAPKGVSAIGASAGVSTDRFWPVLGRVLLMSIAVGVGTQIIATAFGPFGSPLDADGIAAVFEFDDDSFAMNDFSIRSLFASDARLALALGISALLSAVGSIVTTSAFMRLYLDSGAPSDLGSSPAPTSQQ